MVQYTCGNKQPTAFRKLKYPKLKNLANTLPGVVLAAHSAYMFFNKGNLTEGTMFLLFLTFAIGVCLCLLAFAGRGIFYRRLKRGSEITYKNESTGQFPKAFFIPVWQLLPRLGTIKSIWEHP